MTTPIFTWTLHSVTDESGNILVATQSLETVTLADGTQQPVPHLIVIPPEAIGARMALYGLATPQEALDAILREHGCRISPDITLPATPTTAADFGGTSDAVAIDHADGTIPTQIDAVVADHHQTIHEAKDARWEDERYVKFRGSTPLGKIPATPKKRFPAH